MSKRVFLIVLDSFGIGGAKDADKFGDLGSNTLFSVSKDDSFFTPNMASLGLFDIDNVEVKNRAYKDVVGCYARLEEISAGKDTTIGHWEIAGAVTSTPFPTYPNGFPPSIIQQFEEKTGKKVLVNKPYSGTKVISEYGKQHIESGDLIVYTSSDSVFQIAAHEDVVPIDKLYEYCKIARDILQGDNAVARVIARPFVGEYPNFVRTSNRRDFSLEPPINMLDKLKENGKDVIGVGKIFDIFNGRGITESYHTTGNKDGENTTIKLIDKDFDGLCFVNLVDFDMLYGHRNDVKGYATALTNFDVSLHSIMDKLKDDDILMITADHGCDPATESTDHSRENVPLLIYGKKLKSNINLNTKRFSDVSATILDYFNIDNSLSGNSFLSKII